MKVFGIKKSREFQEISKQNIKYHAKTLLILSAPTPDFYLHDPKPSAEKLEGQKFPEKKFSGRKITKFCRFGQTVSKKIGNAVVRNKVKRRIRAAMLDISRDALDKLNQIGYLINNQDYIIIAKKEIKDASYPDIISDLKFCFKGIVRLNNSSKKTI